MSITFIPKRLQDVSMAFYLLPKRPFTIFFENRYLPKIYIIFTGEASVANVVGEWSERSSLRARA